MAKVLIRDLKNKPHTLTLINGETIHIDPKGTVEVEDESLISEVIKNEAKANLLALSVSPVGDISVSQKPNVGVNHSAKVSGKNDGKNKSNQKN